MVGGQNYIHADNLTVDSMTAVLCHVLWRHGGPSSQAAKACEQKISYTLFHHMENEYRYISRSLDSELPRPVRRS